MTTRSQLLDRLMGRQVAEKLTAPIDDMQQALDDAGVQNKALDTPVVKANESQELTDAIMAAVSSGRPPEEVRAELNAMLDELVVLARGETPDPNAEDAPPAEDAPVDEAADTPPPAADESAPPPAEDAEDEDEEEERPAKREASDSDVSKAYQLVSQLVNDQAEQARTIAALESTVKALTDQQQNATKSVDGVVEALRGRVEKLETAARMKPRMASRDNSTVIDSGTLAEQMKEANSQYDPMWGFNRNLSKTGN